MMEEKLNTYPVTLLIDYPGRKLNRLTTFFRIFTVIPIAIVLCLIGGANSRWTKMDAKTWQFASGGILFLPTVLMILFRQKYPKWWFDFNVALTKFSMRVGTYMTLLTDVYPSTDEEQTVHIEIPYPNARKS